MHTKPGVSSSPGTAGNGNEPFLATCEMLTKAQWGISWLIGKFPLGFHFKAIFLSNWHALNVSCRQLWDSFQIIIIGEKTLLTLGVNNYPHHLNCPRKEHTKVKCVMGSTLHTKIKKFHLKVQTIKAVMHSWREWELIYPALCRAVNTDCRDFQTGIKRLPAQPPGLLTFWYGK